MPDEAVPVERALRAGAHGYVTTEEGTETALQAIHLLMQGKRYLGAEVAAKMIGKGSA
jgi:DNA-binding NarL/FixJ family response regulator